jgi:hypothetical protein
VPRGAANEEMQEGYDRTLAGRQTFDDVLDVNCTMFQDESLLQLFAWGSSD